jgi:hypothetical protein
MPQAVAVANIKNASFDLLAQVNGKSLVRQRVPRFRLQGSSPAAKLLFKVSQPIPEIPTPFLVSYVYDAQLQTPSLPSFQLVNLVLKPSFHPSPTWRGGWWRKLQPQ